MPLPQAGTAPHGEVSPETVLPPEGKSLGVTSSTPSIVGQFMGALAVVSPHWDHRRLRGSATGNLMEKGRGFQHWVLADQICTCRAQFIVPTCGFAHLQSKSMVPHGQRTWQSAGLHDSGPQMRSYTSPRAWSAHFKVEELSYTVLPAVACLSASPSQKAYSGKIRELSEVGLPVPPRLENRHSLTCCQFGFWPVKRKGCLRTPEKCCVIQQCLSPEAGGQS